MRGTLFVPLLAISLIALRPVVGFAAERVPRPSGPLPTDRHGDPLPPGAIARLGTVRLRHPGASHLAFSPDGKLLASVGWKARVWRTDTGELISEFDLGQDRVIHTAFSSDGELLLIADREGGLCQWDWRRGKSVKSLRIPKECLAISNDGTIAICVGGDDLSFEVHDLTSEGRPRLISLNDGEPLSRRNVVLAIAPDGKTAIFLDADHRLRLLNMKEGQAGKQIDDKISPKTRLLRYTVDGKCLASLDNNGRIWLHTLGGGQPLLLDLDGAVAVAFSPSGRVLACVDNWGVIRQFDRSTAASVGPTKKDPSWFGGAQFHSDGTAIVSGTIGTERGSFIWDWRADGDFGTLEPIRITIEGLQLL